MNDLIEIDRNNIWHPFSPLQGDADLPLIEKGDGVYLQTIDGRRIIDAISSWWVNLHGHANETIARAIGEQAQKLEHVIFAGFTHEPAISLTKKLMTVLPSSYDRIFFSDNGSTAVEVALKMSIQYWHNRGLKRRKVIAIRGGYHGDTFGAMSVAERGLFTEPFTPYLFETTFIDFPSPEREDLVLEEFKDIVGCEDVAAFIFEPLVQAAGGMRIYSSEVLDRLVDVAHSHGVICIADEVFTGFGRTGKMLAVDYLRNKPDIITLSKGITGGFLALGATACSEKVSAAFSSSSLSRTFFHGHSYTANPLACAAANASFDLLVDEDCQQRIRTISRCHEEFAATLRTQPGVADVRSLGTILAVELATVEGSGYTNRLREAIYPYFLNRNILLRPLGNVLYVLPPYVITEAELRSIYDAILEFVTSR